MKVNQTMNPFLDYGNFLTYRNIHICKSLKRYIFSPYMGLWYLIGPLGPIKNIRGLEPICIDLSLLDLLFVCALRIRSFGKLLSLI